jgi:GntR family transcriptional repressor for pyruvate dehydrogenase complex
MNADAIRDPIDLLLRTHSITRNQIIEARELLEVKIAGLAAQRAAPQDIEAMQATIEKMATGKLTPPQFAATDVAFHKLLARAAGNPLFLAMANSINDVMINLRLSYTDLYGMAQAVELAVQDHSQILAQVKARDVEGARLAMEKHLAHTRKVLEAIEASMAEEDRVSAFSDVPERPVSS